MSWRIALPLVLSSLAALGLTGCGTPPAVAPPAASAVPAVVATATRSCDELAAHPEDVGRTAPGVADDDIQPEPAIEQCLRALEDNQHSARLHFQLGRAYWVDQESDDAVAAFLKAEELGYTPAYFYLGLAFEQGLVSDESPDPELAMQMFLLAAAAGFPPAVRAYEDGER